jgi:hypothetical protein
MSRKFRIGIGIAFDTGIRRAIRNGTGKWNSATSSWMFIA